MTIEEIKMQELKKQFAEQELKYKQRINDIKNNASKIPGLIAGQSIDNEEINEEFEKALEQWVNQPISTSPPMPPPMPCPAPPSNYWGMDEYLKRTPPPPYYNPYITNKPLGKNTRISPRSPDYNPLNNYIDKKSAFEDIIDTLFSYDEKVGFLESIGYRFLPNSSYVVKGEPDPEFKRTFTVSEAFLIEITIKFKNVLLAKGTIKLKM